MLEKITNSWTIGLYSLVENSRFTPKVSNLWDKESFTVQPINDTKITRPDILLGYLIIFWIVLYFMYEKCVNVSFKNLFCTFIRYVLTVLINEFVNYFFFWSGLFTKSADKG